MVVSVDKPSGALPILIRRAPAVRATATPPDRTAMTMMIYGSGGHTPRNDGRTLIPNYAQPLDELVPV
jgi:hypothetical protein